MSAFDSAFLRRLRRNSADFLGQRALETPNCLPFLYTSVSASRSIHVEAVRRPKSLILPFPTEVYTPP